MFKNAAAALMFSCEDRRRCAVNFDMKFDLNFGSKRRKRTKNHLTEDPQQLHDVLFSFILFYSDYFVSFSSNQTTQTALK